LLSAVLLLTQCSDWKTLRNKDITMEAFSDMKTPAFVFDHQAIAQQLSTLAEAEKPQTEADRRLCDYYKGGGTAVWIDAAGADYRADSLMAWLQQVGDIGMTPRSFCTTEIQRDLQRLRQLDFDEGKNNINRVAARLEYHLSKACLRYCYGQRFGFVNPHRVFNHLDVEKQDTARRFVKYRGLFDQDMELPGEDYAKNVIYKVAHHTIADYLREIQPQGTLYTTLKDMLPTAASDEQRRRIICNMERCRWRLHKPINEDEKRIVVNIPSYQLYAYGDDSVLHMRVVCGALKTKTPQLTSDIEWMEVNPQWVIPMSIMENDVARHAGDSAYFARNHYDIYERATNRQMEVGEVTRQMLLSGKYRVAQRSGSHNSLGRIVFRFKNKYSVFLHYTSNPSAFQRESRAISHGCVRVAKPFELAHFVLDNPDEWLLERIRIAMELKPETEQGKNYVATHDEEERKKLIGYVPVKPRVPLYIIYYTMWPNHERTLQEWPDVYGYDKVLWTNLQPMMR
jgi:murein L,D-transpeptidase YcbB/YkuD